MKDWVNPLKGFRQFKFNSYWINDSLIKERLNVFWSQFFTGLSGLLVFG